MQNKLMIRGYDTEKKVMLSRERLEKENYALGIHGDMVQLNAEVAKAGNLLITKSVIPLLWTGQKDVKGDDIYQEDIFEENGIVAVVVWDFKKMMFVVLVYGADGNLSLVTSISDVDLSRAKVVGNTFQNRNLIPNNYEEVRNQQSYEGYWKNGRVSNEQSLQPRGA